MGYSQFILHYPTSEMIAGRYTLLEQLGAGGMGAVYRAYDRLAGQYVALKQVIIAPGSLSFASKSDVADYRVALAREFRTLAGLRHPNIISVLDYGFDANQLPYFTMELLDSNRSLAQVKLPLEEAMRVVMQILQALAYLSRRGLSHRDLKPSNVMQTEHRQVKVLDFGLAADIRSLQSKEVVGTFAYVAPELLRGGSYNTLTDLYAAGIIFYEILVGQHPLNINSAQDFLQDVLSDDEIDVSALPETVRCVVARLLAKNPSARWQSAEAAMQALTQAAGWPIAEDGDVRESYLQSSHFVGRDAELSSLVEALERACQGEGSVYLIGGESGVGKSRLLDELRALALVQGALVVRGESVESGGLPFQLWQEPIRRLALSVDVSELEAAVLKAIVPNISMLLERDVPDLPSLNAKNTLDRLAQTVVAVLERQPQPVVLMLEDLQWSSESLDLLTLLVQHAPSHDWLIVGTYRIDEAADLPDRLSGTNNLRLDRLPDEAVAALSKSMIGNVGEDPRIIDLIQRETEGNTFFMVEVIRALAEEAGSLSNIQAETLPDAVFASGMQAILQRRLAHVPDEYRHTLELAAVLGRMVEPDVLTWHGGAVDDFLLTAASASVLEVRDGHWQFAHDKLRDALLVDLDLPQRVRLHTEAAQALEATYVNHPEQAARLAHHWGEAMDQPKLVHYSFLAGKHAFVVSQYDLAWQYFDKALAHTDNIETSVLALIRLGQVSIRTNRLDDAQARLLEAQTLAPDTYRAEILNDLSRIAWLHSDYPTSKAHATEALECARRLNQPQQVAMALNHLGNIADVNEDQPQARIYFTESLAIRRTLGDLVDISASLNNLSLIATAEGQFDEARALLTEKLAINEALGDRWGLAFTWVNLGWVAYIEGDLDQAKACDEKSLLIRRELGDQWGMGSCLLNLGQIALLQDRADEAEALLIEALQAYQNIGHRIGSAEAMLDLSRVYSHRGQLDSARQLLSAGMSLALEVNTERALRFGVLAGVYYQLARGNVQRAAQWIGMFRRIGLSPLLEMTRLTQTVRTILPDTIVNALFEQGESLTLNAIIHDICSELD